MYACVCGCESGTDTGLSVSTDIGSKIFLSELIESSLSVAKIFCDVSFSNAGIGLQEKQQLGEGAREKIIQDKILARWVKAVKKRSLSISIIVVKSI